MTSQMKTLAIAVSGICLILLITLLAYEPSPTQFNLKQTVEKEGIEISFEVKPIENKKDIVEGDDVKVEFSIRDKATQNPVTGLHPGAWIDGRKEAKVADTKLCTNKVTSFLSGNFSARPNFDLNAFYVISMNKTPTLSVVDPLFSFGGSQLLSKVFLRGPAEDWVKRGDRIFVTMPKVNQVAVVDTFTWKVELNIKVGSEPGRIALQPDEQYIWVANNGKDKNGITIVDAEKLKVVGYVDLKESSHDIVFSSDNTFAYVSGRETGNVHIIDVRKLVLHKTIKTGKHATSMAFSKQSNMLYVTDKIDGQISVIHGNEHRIAASIQSKPGLDMIRMVPNRPVAVAINRLESELLVIDPATNQILKSGGVEKEPFEITFTEGLIYVRAMQSDLVLMIPIEGIDQANIPVKVIEFTGGESHLSKAGSPSEALSIVQAPAGNAVLVANPMDRMIYYYAEGMAAPMGSFKTYGDIGRAVMVVDRSLQEVKPGTYSTTIKFNDLGLFDVAFFMDSPRMVHCFDMAVAANPKLKKIRTPKVLVKPLKYPKDLKAGESAEFTFQVFDGHTNLPKSDLKNVGVMASLAPGVWQTRINAKDQGKGVYSFELELPEAGVYYIFYRVPEIGMDYHKIPYNIVQIKAHDKTS